MALAKKATTIVSTKGQVILPKAIRDSKGWGAGKELVVEETREGVLLRAARPFAPTKPEEVFGSLSHHGKRLSDQDIEKALHAAAKRRYARD
jgi:AbrB family looped-hinge helix DNA binding protein